MAGFFYLMGSIVPFWGIGCYIKTEDSYNNVVSLQQDRVFFKDRGLA